MLTSQLPSINKDSFEFISDLPSEILSSPALLFLYYRIEQILGIKAAADSLNNLNQYLEKSCGSSFIENPAAYEFLLTSREQIYNISKLLTINETYFFREGIHFTLLTNLLPDLIKLGKPLQICCAAVSIGCEAYTIAMLLDYYIKKGFRFDYYIDAFDINLEAIETAKNARYNKNTFRADGVSWKHILDSYLIQDNNEFIVVKEIQNKVNFFPHNIMRGLEKQYDIIFFRNSLIYFSSKNRLSVLNNLAESLNNNGLLFLGISETASVKHPLLINRFQSDVFYFQKTSILNEPEFKPIEKQPSENITINIKNNKINENKKTIEKEIKPIVSKNVELAVNITEISEIIKKDEGKQNSADVFEAFEKDKIDLISGSRITACALYFLNTQNFDTANKIISFLEKNNSCVYTKFLRGEYYYLLGKTDEAEKYYNEAAIKNKYFWPAFYRISFLVSDGNKTRHEYKIKKTIESIKLSQGDKQNDEHNYECFMGGFSPDYFIRILEKKLT